MVFQNYALYPHMTVFDNMAFGLKLRGYKACRVRRSATPGRARGRIAGHHAPVGAQAEGALRRAAPARRHGPRHRAGTRRYSCSTNRLSNLDAKLRVQMRTEIKKRAPESSAPPPIFVTHDQVEAMTLADRVVVMNAGRIEQVGPPQELYHRPANRFVAGFIGSPGMNFLPVRVQPGAAALRLADGTSLAIPASRADRYRPHIGRDMVLGLRPEHITDEPSSGREGMAPLAANTDVVEPMGMETLVHFFIGADPVIARCDPATQARPGEPLPLQVNMNHMHLLEPGDGGLVV